MREIELTFKVAIQRDEDTGAMMLSVVEQGVAARVLIGRPNDTWMLAQHAGELVGLRIQEEAVHVRGAVVVPPPKPLRKSRKATKKKATRKRKKK